MKRVSLFPLLRTVRRRLGLIELHGHHVFARALSKASVVVDGGAHRGEFARGLRDRCGCRIHAFEPNPALPVPADFDPEIRWRPIGLAAASATARLVISQNPEASTIRPDLVESGSTLQTVEIEVWDIETLFRRLGVERLDLLKLDVEGAEIELLRSASDQRLRAIDQLTVEFHSFVAGEEEKADVEEVSRRLESLGFLRLRATAPAPDDTDVLFVNRRSIRIPLLTRFWIACGEPLLAGLRRLGALVRAALQRNRADSASKPSDRRPTGRGEVA